MVVGYAYFPGIAYGVLAADDCAMREIEDAVRIAERSGDDLAVAYARVTLGMALVHRHTDVERDRGQTLLAEVTEVFLRQGYLLAELPMLNVYLARERARRGNPMAPSRSCAPPSTICSARDSCHCGAFLRPAFWCRHCSTAGLTMTWPKPRPRSSG